MSEEMSENDFDWENRTWGVIDTFFKQDNILIDHHLNSFNYFMSYKLQSIIREKEFILKIFNKDTWNEDLQLYTETYQVEFVKLYISKPVLYDSPNKPMYPNEARLRKLTYGGNLYIDIHHKTIKINPETGEQEIIPHPTLEKYPCGRMPIMVGSKYCVLSDQNNITKAEMGEGVYDYGGYFIIKGSEKIIISQEKKCENKICCFKQKATQSKYSDNAEISSVHPDNPSIVSPVWVKMKAKEESYGGNVIRVRLRRMKQDIPLVIIFRALNFISDKSIVELIVYNISNEMNTSMMELLKASIEESKPIQSQKLALEYISKYIQGINSLKYKTNKCKLKYTFDILCDELFPHVGESPIKKGYFLGYMVNKLLKCNLGISNYDDRDSFLNKRIETSGELMAQLFRAYFGKFIKDLKMICDKDMLAGRISELPQNLTKKLKPNSIENDIKFALGTGNWGLKNQAKSRKGIAAVLQRLTYLGTLSNMRRIVAPIDKNGKLTDPRKLHCTQFGVICPFETPEGGSIGIVKNMALTCQITIPYSDEPIKSLLDENGVMSLEGIKASDIFDSVKVFVNGDWYGQSFEPKILVDNLKDLRRKGIINPFVSIAWYIQHNEIQIWSDGGRLCRPLYIIKDNAFMITNKFVDKVVSNKMTWKDILIDDNAMIEYIDINESDTLMICMSKDNLLENSKKNYSYYNYTHCEIHPSLMLGVLACNIPFPEHNQAPRNLYQGAMGKQAMGIYSTAFRERMDTMAHILHYPQKPLVNTEISKYVHSNDLPSGQMPIVAIACYTGYNQEDSLIFNQSAIDRGLFKSSFFRTYMDEEKKNSATLEDEKFCKPQKFYPNGKVYTEKMSYGSYDKLDTNGFVKVDSFVEGNDIIIGKVTMLKDAVEGDPKARDLSTPLRSNESGIVDKVYKNSNGDGYNFVKVRIRSDRIPEIGDKFACVPPNTMIYTTNGMKMIKDITMNDKVAVLDIENDNIKYEYPEKVHCYDYTGKMYKVHSQLVDLTVTPNHRMWIKRRFGNGSNYKKEFEFMNADDCFGRRLKYKKTVENFKPENWIGETFTIPEYIDDNNKIREKIIVKINDWISFFGIWLAEGWTDKNRVSIASHKQRVRNVLKPIIQEWKYNISEGNFNWSFGDVQLANYMEQFSVGPINKFFPEWIWRLNKEQSRLFIDSMMLGNGYINKSNANLYYTSSKKMAEDLCRLCIHAGWSSHMRLHDGRVTDNYTITIIKTKLEPEVNHGHSEEWIDYEGTVHCLTVSSGVFLVSENGKPVWTGNSRHGQKGTIGLTYKQEDMPFTKDGIVPDIIMNPNAIPKRMTIAQLIECVFGKVGTMAGSELDATPFRKVTVENITEIMEKMGYNGAGTEVLYNGKTGEQITAAIFMGPTFYYRLKHLVEDKQHSRATGPYQLLTMQPAEGRSRDGGFRFGEMERDCADYRTPISQSYGLSIQIQYLEGNTDEVLGWSEKENGMIKSKQTNFKYKGERECVELTMEDGKKIICTPDHKILTSLNEWIPAKDLKVDETRIKASVNYPEMNIQEEIKECNNWELKFGTCHLKTDTKNNFMKTLAFARMLGYLTNDGGIYMSNNTSRGYVSLGHKLDTDGFLDDLYRLDHYGTLKFRESQNYYSINFDPILTDNIMQLKGILIGKKVTQAAVLPDFILDPLCPKPIVREFLGGIFGADGHTCYLGLHRGKRDILSSVSYSKTKNHENIESLTNMLENIKTLLARFDINIVTIQKAKEITNSKKINGDNVDKNSRNYEQVLHIDLSELLKFHSKIGFRYCCHKTQRLEAAVSYKRLRNEVIRQHNWMVNRVDEITHFKEIKSKDPKKIVHTKDAIIQAIKELKETEPLMHEYAIPSTHDITDHLIKGTEFGKFTSKSFPTAEDFLQQIGALDWFLDKEYGVNRENNSIPTMNLKVIDIRPVGEHKVYDIEVEETNSFLANGIVVHNCMLSHGTAQFLKERTFDCSDKYYVWIDNETGMISPVNPEKGIYKSLYSDNTTKFSKVQIPYSSKLLIQELQSMHINPRMMVGKKN